MVALVDEVIQGCLVAVETFIYILFAMLGDETHMILREVNGRV
jgi:hypothetical protein